MADDFSVHLETVARHLDHFAKDEAMAYCIGLLEEGALTVPLLYENVLAPALNKIIVPRPQEDRLIWREHAMTAIVRSIIECARPYVMREKERAGAKGSAGRVLRQDYVRTARSKGLREVIIITRHMVRNSLIPVVTILGPALAGLVTGSFIIETMFGFPGMGRAYVTAIGQRDYSMIMGTTLIFAILIALANMSVDLVYVFLDPRIRLD